MAMNPIPRALGAIRWRAASAIIGVALTSALGSPAAGAQARIGDDEGASYVRSRDDAAARAVMLDVADRVFRGGPDRPSVRLVGAVHIGSKEYYEAMQRLLDDADLVLFEGVQPPGLDEEFLPEDAPDSKRIQLTRMRQQVAAQMISEYIGQTSRAPKSWDDLREGVKSVATRWVPVVSVDGWGREVSLTLNEARREVTLTSFGADGASGGDGPDADVIETLDLDDLGDDPAGIQRTLADSLRLEFQMDAMDYSGAHWVPSDMDMGELADAMGLVPGEPGEDDGSFGSLMGLMSGSSFGGKVASALIKIVGMNKTWRSMAKLMMVDMLADADALLEAQGGEMGKLMDVLIHRRNEVVVEDLRRAIKDMSPEDEIAVFYGAGHLRDLERSLVEELGYEAGEISWTPAMSVRLSDTGMSESQVGMLRSMMKSQIQAQIRRGG